MKRELNFIERVAFINYVVDKTLTFGMEYRDFFIDCVIANYYYDYTLKDITEETKDSPSEWFENTYADIKRIKKSNKDFYSNELMKLIKVIDKKLDFEYQKEIHKNPLNESLARLINVVTDFTENYADTVNSEEVKEGLTQIKQLLPTLEKMKNEK